jgi:hypothetical protein
MSFSEALQILATGAVLLSLGTAPRAQQATKIDITGTWSFTIESSGTTGTPTVTFKQNGEALTGHYSSMFLGEAELTGTIHDRAVEFTVHAEIQGTKLESKFEATLEGPDSMKGKTSTPGFPEGTFVGKRKP